MPTHTTYILDDFCLSSSSKPWCERSSVQPSLLGSSCLIDPLPCESTPSGKSIYPLYQVEDALSLVIQSWCIGYPIHLHFCIGPYLLPVWTIPAYGGINTSLYKLHSLSSDSTFYLVAQYTLHFCTQHFNLALWSNECTL